MSIATRAHFITVEGSEGAGKSTNIQILMEVLEERRIAYYSTREPGGTELAEELRTMVLQPRDENVDDLTELLLIFAARRQHVKNVIEPRLSAVRGDVQALFRVVQLIARKVGIPQEEIEEACATPPASDDESE